MRGCKSVRQPEAGDRVVTGRLGIAEVIGSSDHGRRIEVVAESTARIHHITRPGTGAWPVIRETEG